MAKIILTADVANLGGPGDIVEVKDGYARNYLLPRSLAITATKGAERQVQSIRRAQEARRIRDLDHANEVKQRIESLPTIALAAKTAPNSKRLFGSVTPADVVNALKAAGGPTLDKRSIDLGGHVKTTGKHPVTAHLHKGVNVTFPLQVRATEAE